jgi:hypothetical protein
LCVKARQLFKEHNVQLVAMHPHTTHVFCVLDVAIFALFKRALYSIYSRKAVPGVAVTRALLSKWMRKAYKRATEPRPDTVTGELYSPAVSGFAKTGLHPFKPKLATDVIFAHHREWLKQKEAADMAVEGVAVVDKPSIYALSPAERTELVAGLVKDGKLAIQLAQTRVEGEEGVKRRREAVMSQLLTSDERIRIDLEKETAKEAKEAGMEERRQQRKEAKEARNGLSAAEWAKKQRQEKKAQKEAQKAAAAAAAAAAVAAAAAAAAAAKPAPKKVRAPVKAPKAEVVEALPAPNVYAKSFPGAGRRGVKRGRE